MGGKGDLLDQPSYGRHNPHLLGLGEVPLVQRAAQLPLRHALGEEQPLGALQRRAPALQAQPLQLSLQLLCAQRLGEVTGARKLMQVYGSGGRGVVAGAEACEAVQLLDLLLALRRPRLGRLFVLAVRRRGRPVLLGGDSCALEGGL
jgi:hypothetical protein